MSWLVSLLKKAWDLVRPIPPYDPGPPSPTDALKEEMERNKPEWAKQDQEGEHKVIVNVLDIKF